MYIVKNTNGKVELYDERSCCQRTILVSNAVYADIDTTHTRIVITQTNGRVELYN